MINIGCLLKGKKSRKAGLAQREADFNNNTADLDPITENGLVKLEQGRALTEILIVKDDTDNDPDRPYFDLKRTKDDLRSYKELLDHTQQLSRTGSFELELTNGKIKASEMFYEIFGIEKDMDISIEMILSFIHPDDLNRMDGFIISLFNGKPAQSIEFRFVKPKELMELFLLMNTRTITSENSVDKKVIGIVQEITARKVAENALLKSNIELAGLKGEMMERESRVLEMKAEVNQLCVELGIEPRYVSY